MASKFCVFEIVSKKVGTWFNWMALVALTVMLFLVTVDIVGAKLFKHPVPGAMDMVSLLGAIVTAFAATETLILGRHIEIDFLVRRLSNRFRMVLACLADFICLVFLAVVVWRCFLYGHDIQITGEVTPSQKIPLAPFAYAIAFAFVPMLLISIMKFFRSFRSIVTK